MREISLLTERMLASEDQAVMELTIIYKYTHTHTHVNTSVKYLRGVRVSYVIFERMLHFGGGEAFVSTSLVCYTVLLREQSFFRCTEFFPFLSHSEIFYVMNALLLFANL